MKMGIRKPNYKKRLKARTTGKIKRQVKKAVVPGYGKKGMGWIKDPKKAAYNKVYNKTTVSVDQMLSSSSKSKKVSKNSSVNSNTVSSKSDVSFKNRTYSAMMLFLGIILIGVGMSTTFIISILGIIVLLLSVILRNSDSEQLSSEINAESDNFIDAAPAESDISSARKITSDDMTQFNFQQYQMTNVINDGDIAIMLIDSSNRLQVMSDINSMNEYIDQAIELSGIKINLTLDPDEMFFGTKNKGNGEAQYYTYFECNPYTPTGKISKYPLILHYATDSFDKPDPEINFFGQLYYMADGSIGKVNMVFWVCRIMYNIELALRNHSLCVRKVSKHDRQLHDVLYKI